MRAVWIGVLLLLLKLLQLLLLLKLLLFPFPPEDEEHEEEGDGTGLDQSQPDLFKKQTLLFKIFNVCELLIANFFLFNLIKGQFLL